MGFAALGLSLGVAAYFTAYVVLADQGHVHVKRLHGDQEAPWVLSALLSAFALPVVLVAFGFWRHLAAGRERAGGEGDA
jgi:hypothetical protein